MNIEYEIVNKEEIPDISRLKTNKWIWLFQQLPDDEAIKIHVNSITDANAKRTNILGTFRKARKERLNLNFNIHTRKQDNLDGSFELFVWKELIE